MSQTHAEPDRGSQPSVEPPMSARERRLSIFFSGMAFFFSYVLTAGPAVFLVDRFDLPMVRTIVRVLYAPLVLILKLKVPVIGPAIEAWVDLFR